MSKNEWTFDQRDIKHAGYGQVSVAVWLKDKPRPESSGLRLTQYVDAMRESHIADVFGKTGNECAERAELIVSANTLREQNAQLLRSLEILLLNIRDDRFIDFAKREMYVRQIEAAISAAKGKP